MKTMVLLMVMAFTMTATNSITLSGYVYDQQGTPLSGVSIRDKNKQLTRTDTKGFFTVPLSKATNVVFSKSGFEDYTLHVSSTRKVVVNMTKKIAPVTAEEHPEAEMLMDTRSYSKKTMHMGSGAIAQDYQPMWNTESYSTITENIFHTPTDEPLSTFSIDVDVASYANMRRFIQNGQRPPIDAVRIEELINYFTYDYAQPKGEHPFAIHTELVESPWNTNQILRIGLQGRTIPKENLPASNLVFLIDVSGSMSSANKLPLLKSSFKLLVNELRPEDRVSIVVYAGAAGVVLPPTSGAEKATIINALERLQAGGSTAGGEGIKLAYKMAQEQFIEDGNNRVIIATDGDFNVGASSDAEMERLITRQKESGVFLTALGFGMGNYKDSKMETLADKGNGNYAYIDSFSEAKKVLGQEFGGTLFTIAKDVKIQIEFNPAHVQAYRLIGYENRLLNKEDFNNDKKDAGELGSGHSVTALYEVVPSGREWTASVDPLKYQESKPVSNSAELATVKFRYKDPDGSRSKLLQHVVATEARTWRKASTDTQWASAVAAFGMYIRNSEHLDAFSLDGIHELAMSASGEDRHGYRKELIEMITLFEQLQ